MQNKDLPFENLLLASDIEAKGFWEKVHTKKDIHCLASQDVDTEIIYLFHDYPEFDGVEVFDKHDGKMYTIPPRTGTLEEGFRWWEKATLAGSKLIVHNARTYDEPITHKVDPDCKIPYDAWHDTLNQSKRQWFERPTPRGCKGAHGLAAWGKRIGIDKPEVTDWEHMDAYKLHRVLEDIKIQRETYLRLEHEKTLLMQKYGINFDMSISIEDKYATECHNQEINGALIDVEHYEACLVELDGLITDLTHEIEPQLPLTVKQPAKKLSRKELAEALGFDPARTRDTWVKKKKDGMVNEVIEKPFSAPSVNYHRTVKQKYYSATSIEHGFTDKFKKKNELTGWIKENFPNTKPTKDWEIEVAVEETKLLNKNTCEYWGLAEDDTDMLVGPYTKVSFIRSTMTQHDRVKLQLIRLGWHYVNEWNLATDFNKQKIKVKVETEVRWPAKAAPHQQLVKIIPEGGLMVSSPKFSKDDYEQLPDGLGKKITEYNSYAHRRRFISSPNDPENKGLLSYVREDGRLPCGVNNFATRSGRGSQRGWVNAPSESALYGKEVRQGIIAGKGKKIVGIDQKSAQLSIAAYYANNSEYYDAVASGLEEDEEGNYIGESAHCFNARAFGLVSDEEWKEAVLNNQHDLLSSIGLRRKKSKGGSFACLPVDNTTVAVNTDEGLIKLKYHELIVGQEVLVYDASQGCYDFNPIEKIHHFDNKKVTRIHGQDDWLFEATEEHRWLMRDYSYKATKDLRAGDVIMNSCYSSVQVVGLERNLPARPTFCITTKCSNFFAQQGDINTLTGNCIFGSGGEKMAVTLGIPKNQGNEKKDNFLKEIGLDNVNKYLKEVVAKETKCRGGWYLPVAFGYWLWNNSHHKNLNTVVQGFEAVAQKLAVVKAAQLMKDNGIEKRALKILDVHDEMLYECDEEVADLTGQLVCEAYTWSALQIYKYHRKYPDAFSNYGGPKFPIDLAGGYKVGNNYYEVH